MIALLGRLAYQLIENQFAMLLECAQALFKRKEQRLRQLWGLARIKRVLNDYTLANDLDCQFGEVAVGLGKMLLNAIYGSNLMDRPGQSTNDTRATGGLPKNGKRCPKNARRCPKNATNSNVSRVR
jgi:hypothetical protein